MRTLAVVLALAAGAFMLSNAAPEPACAFDFCTGVKPPKPQELHWPPGCPDMCVQCRDVGRDGFWNCRWVWVCC